PSSLYLLCLFYFHFCFFYTHTSTTEIYTLSLHDALPISERRQMVLAVRQVVDKDVAPVCQELDRAGAYPAELVGALADLGVLGAVIPQDWGGLGLDVRTYAMLVEELARGSAALATVVARHAAVAHALARFGTDEQKHRI